MRGLSISSIQADPNSDNVSIAGSLASEVTRNAAKTISTVSKLKLRLSRSNMSMLSTDDVEATSINVPSRTHESGTKVYSESMPAMTTTTNESTKYTVSSQNKKSEI